MIARTLAEGWDYQHDWRFFVAEQRLQEKPDATISELCDGEEDLVVRQYLRYRKTGKCAAANAFRYVEKCRANRNKNLCAVIVEAMTIAGFDRDRIAERAGTTPINISIYQLMNFDIRRELHHREWLATIALPSTPVSPGDHVAFKQRAYFASAFHAGVKGLEAVMTRSIPRACDAEKMATAIQSMLLARAHEYLLHCSQSPASEQDFGRYVEFARIQPPTDRSQQTAKLDAFGARVRAAIMKKTADADATRTSQTASAQRPGSFSQS